MPHEMRGNLLSLPTGAGSLSALHTKRRKQRKHQRAYAIAYENMGKWTITNPGCSYTYLKDNKPVRFSQGTTGIRIQTQWYHLVSPADFESSSGNGVQRLTTLVMEPRIG